jgi:hypothetical protein
MITVLGPDGATDSTTISGNAAKPLYAALGLGEYSSPLAGHGFEGNGNQNVIKTGFRELYALMNGKVVADRETVVYDATEATLPPAAP